MMAKPDKDKESAPAEACPVDHATREAWLKSNRSQPAFPAIPPPETHLAAGCDSSGIDKASSTTSPSSKGFFSRFTTSPSSSIDTPNSLGVDRKISTIPRASPVNDTQGATPANNEKESGVSASGNWIYPSEKMFFEAMKRKGFQSDVADMKTIVPIHNAVNERAWKEIKDWEKPWGSERCGGPKLYSFLGLSSTLSPKARLNSFLGYTPPFDRHDWVVDRCGTRIEYIIDFYAGKDEGRGNGKLNFFLDVRPKLNTLEGWKMRGARLIGLV